MADKNIYTVIVADDEALGEDGRSGCDEKKYQRLF